MRCVQKVVAPQYHDGNDRGMGKAMFVQFSWLLPIGVEPAIHNDDVTGVFLN